MDDKRVAELIQQNLTSIYGYAFARLYDKDKVDDLTSEIICEILTSAKRLKNEDSFWGFAWKIAENTFRKFIKKEAYIKKTEELLEEQGTEADRSSPEQDYVDKEEHEERIYLLRRELSLLSKTHREVCVAYYVDNKSCSQIAYEQNISVEMVKYHLFKTRKLLKEGIGMTRTLGEKSYNPGTFRLDFWGDSNKYWDIFKRKLPGSIMLAAYHLPLSAKELSVELGVSMPYLEEEIEMLEKAGLLAKVGAKYQTNVVIITDDYEKEFVRKTLSVYDSIADSVFEKVKLLLPQIRTLGFFGDDYDDNRLMFAFLNMAMVKGYHIAEARSPLGEPNKLALGCNGWIFGYDNDYVNHHFIGVTMETWNKEGTAWFSAENYKAIMSCQIYDHSRFSEKAQALCDAILGKPADSENEMQLWLIDNGFAVCTDDKLSANFPVFDSLVYEEVLKVLAPVTEIIADCMIDISDRAEAILADHVPAAVKNQCGDIAKIHHRLAVAAFLMENLIDKNKLTLPSKKTPLCVWGVRK